MKSAAKPKRRKDDSSDGWRRFWAESEYAQSVLNTALGDSKGIIGALRRSLEFLPTYAPAILSLGSVEYQLGQRVRGRELFLSLLDLSEDTEDLPEIIDKAGDFLIDTQEHAHGLELYQRASERFPKDPALHQGLGCCAGHLRKHDIAIEASRKALELDPQNQQLWNDLGWSLHEAGQLDLALRTLERAAEMNPSDELAANNLSLCRETMRRATAKASRKQTPGRKRSSTP